MIQIFINNGTVLEYYWIPKTTNVMFSFFPRSPPIIPPPFLPGSAFLLCLNIFTSSFLLLFPSAASSGHLADSNSNRHPSWLLALLIMVFRTHSTEDDGEGYQGFPGGKWQSTWKEREGEEKSRSGRRRSPLIILHREEQEKKKKKGLGQTGCSIRKNRYLHPKRINRKGKEEMNIATFFFLCCWLRQS